MLQQKILFLKTASMWVSRPATCASLAIFKKFDLHNNKNAGVVAGKPMKRRKLYIFINFYFIFLSINKSSVQ